MAQKQSNRTIADLNAHLQDWTVDSPRCERVTFGSIATNSPTRIADLMKGRDARVPGRHGLHCSCLCAEFGHIGRIRGVSVSDPGWFELAMAVALPWPF